MALVLARSFAILPLLALPGQRRKKQSQQ